MTKMTSPTSTTSVPDAGLNSTVRLPDLIRGPWKLEDLRQGKLGQPRHGLTVFSCFHCGGGSTMGYKLAGFDVLGGVEIDPEMMEIYRRNHHPKHSFLTGVQDFKAIPLEKLPKELLNLDVLDGSPPCSSFSMAGSREDAWGKSKKFREGQTDQVLDDLFFHFIDIAERLRPKVVVAENVKGLIQGAAKGYVKQIFEAFDRSGYDTQLFLLNASRMGVPQARERTFFIARRKDLKLQKLDLFFNEKTISVGHALHGVAPSEYRPLSPAVARLWPSVKPGEPLSKSALSNGSFFSWRKCSATKPTTTVTATHCLMHWREPRLLSTSEVSRIQSFPDDYDFNEADGPYVCGMSVPPLMMQRVSTEVAKVLLSANKLD